MKRSAVKVASSKQAAEGKAETRHTGNEPVTIDRRRDERRGQEAVQGRRQGSDGSSGGQGSQGSQGSQGGQGRRKLERRAKVNRRRQIDPTTCERDYSQDEIEFMAALDAYKRTSGRMFPTCSEVLEVLRGLGYEKRPPAPATPTEMPATTAPITQDTELNGSFPAFPFAADAACETLIPLPAGV